MKIKTWNGAAKVWSVVLSFALLTAACGGTSNSSSSSSENSGAPGAGGAGVKRAKIDPCSLLTKAEAETALGESADGGGTNEKDLVAAKAVLSVCSYSASNQASKHVNVSVWQSIPESPDPWDVKSMWGNLKSGAKSMSEQRKGGKFESVTGFGDDAYVESWAAGSMGMTELHVLKGDVILGARVPGQDAKALERSKALLTKALGRI